MDETPPRHLPDVFQPRSRLNRFLDRPSNLALSFFLVSVIVLSSAWAGAALLISTSHFHPRIDRLTLPPAFLVSTLLMVLGSGLLHHSCALVRREKQREFLRSLVAALLIGTAFVAVQSYGLWCLVTSHQASAERNGLRNSAFAFAILHGVHFVIALLFVVFVSLRALAGRYDHECSWGVVFCAWFWHVLGILWLVILGAFAIAAAFLAMPPP